MNRVFHDPQVSEPKPPGDMIIDLGRLTPIAAKYFIDKQGDQASETTTHLLIQAINEKVREWHAAGLSRVTILSNVASRSIETAEIEGHALTDPLHDTRLAFVLGVARQVLADIDPGHDGRFASN